MTEKQTMHATMPRDKALEYLESLEKLVNDQFADMGYVVALGMAVREFRAAELDNAPLTLEQLRGMNREPVYLVDMEPLEYGWSDGWYLVDADEDEVSNGVQRFELTQCAGFAYRRPPEKGE